MNAVFECIAKWETACYGSPILRSTILKRTGLNLYQYRKQIKELKDNDLIEYVRHIQRVYSDGYLETPYLEDCYFIQGWLPTDKGRQIEVYKKIAEAEKKEWKNIGGI